MAGPLACRGVPAAARLAAGPGAAPARRTCGAAAARRQLASQVTQRLRLRAKAPRRVASKPPGGDQPLSGGNDGELRAGAPKDVMSLVAGDPTFSFLSEMLNKARRHSPAASHITSQRALTRIFSQAQLAERLTRGSAWTLFAPTNAAFSAALDALGVSPGSLLAHKEVVDALIRLHVVPAKVPVASLRPGAELATLEGSRLPVRLSRGSSGGVDIAGAHLLRADIQATNGIIHVVDDVLLPEELRAKRFARTMPGVVPALGFFDPLGFTDGQTVNEVKRLRESEVTHARVAMVAVVGFLAQEAWHPLFPSIQGPAIIHFQQVPSPFWQLLFVGIGAIELARARRGWVPPWDSLFTLREEYMPGDLNFDPLGLRHSYDGGLEEARARELAYGRVAMFAIVTFVLQELSTAAPVLQMTRNALGHMH